MTLSPISASRALHRARQVTTPRSQRNPHAFAAVRVSISHEAAQRASTSIDTSGALLKGDPHVDLPLPGTPVLGEVPGAAEPQAAATDAAPPEAPASTRAAAAARAHKAVSAYRAASEAR